MIVGGSFCALLRHLDYVPGFFDIIQMICQTWTRMLSEVLEGGSRVLLLQFFVTVVMLAGLLFTFVSKVPGTAVIMAGALLYGLFAGFYNIHEWVWVVLVFLVATAEIGGRLLRIVLTRRFSVSRRLSTDSTVANIGGIIVADALLGPVLGLIVWELIAGKTLQPRWDTILKILTRLAAVAVLRFACGLAMIVIIIVYVFQK